jgi:hypothetical protein
MVLQDGDRALRNCGFEGCLARLPSSLTTDMTLPSIRQHMQSHNREHASGCQRRSSDQ